MVRLCGLYLALVRAAKVVGTLRALFEVQHRQLDRGQPRRGVAVLAERGAGNFYYVGANDVSAFLITGPEGHIVLDAGYPTTAKMIMESIAKLGFDIKPLEDFKVAIKKPYGMVLVTGPTGTGKSTTIAAMLREINERDSLHILTLEDPIEFIHTSQSCQVVQREVGTHVRSFQAGLRAALREDPDVILVGELRDPETVTLAMEAAETGHLVLGTLHTRGAASTIERLVDAHPSENHAQVRHALAENLKAVVSQELVRCTDGRGRRAAHEILIVNVAVQQMIREGKSFQINGAITTGKRLGMQLMDQSLLALVRAGEIDPDEAFLKAEDKWGFAPFLTRPELLGMVSGEFRAA